MDQMKPVSVVLTWPGRLRIFAPFALGYFLSYLFRVINAVLAFFYDPAAADDPALAGCFGFKWSLFGFFGTSGILIYAVLSQSVASRLAGRANAALNLLVFVAAFGF